MAGIWRQGASDGRWCGSCGRPDRHLRYGLIEAAAVCGLLAGQADEIDMGWFSSSNEDRMSQLTAEELRLFRRLNEAVGKAAKAAAAVLDGGRALAEIRDRQLFRDVASDWQGYLSLHGLTRRRADQLIAAAQALDAAVEVVQTKTGTTVPTLDQITERTARELVGMDAETAADAVIEAASSPAGITPASIRKAVAKRKKPKAAKAARPQRFRVPGATVVVTFNRKGTGSALDALAAAMRQAEDQLGQSGEAA